MSGTHAHTRAKAIRDLRGLRSQVDFAAELDVTRGTVIALEKGREPSLRTARRLVELGLSQDVVLEPSSATDADQVAS